MLRKIADKLSSSFNGKGAALGAALIGAAVSITPTPADAADGKIAYDDLRQLSAEFVEFYPSLKSGNGRVALKVNSGDNDKLNAAIYSAALAVENATGRDVAFLHDHDDQPHDGETKIEVWVSGYKTSTLTVYDTTLINEQITAVINDGIKRVKEAEQTAALEKPGADDPS